MKHTPMYYMMKYNRIMKQNDMVLTVDMNSDNTIKHFIVLHHGIVNGKKNIINASPKIYNDSELHQYIMANNK